jgi:protein-histidine pros-kinase
LKLLLKFNLIVIALVAIGLAIVSWVAHSFLVDNARAQIVQQAELMMQSASSTRDYTSQEIKPLLINTPAMQHVFLPQTVPAYGATVTFARLRQKFPEYMYKEATLNPTNLQDRAVDWEADIIEAFRNKPEMKELVNERETPTGRSLYLAHPIIATASCLECHSVPSAAPKVMVDKYGQPTASAGSSTKSSEHRSSPYQWQSPSRSPAAPSGPSCGLSLLPSPQFSSPSISSSTSSSSCPCASSPSSPTA